MEQRQRKKTELLAHYYEVRWNHRSLPLLFLFLCGVAAVTALALQGHEPFSQPTFDFGPLVSWMPRTMGQILWLLLLALTWNFLLRRAYAVLAAVPIVRISQSHGIELNDGLTRRRLRWEEIAMVQIKRRHFRILPGPEADQPSRWSLLSGLGFAPGLRYTFFAIDSDAATLSKRLETLSPRSVAVAGVDD